jgi:quercetin dioxygenase-like cupin family protein
MIHTTLRDHIVLQAERFYKGTLFASEHMLVGIDCLAPHQDQPLHQHNGHDKMYFVHEGTGVFTIGAETVHARAGDVVMAPANVPHAVTNVSDDPLVMLIVMSPFPR